MSDGGRLSPGEWRDSSSGEGSAGKATAGGTPPTRDEGTDDELWEGEEGEAGAAGAGMWRMDGWMRKRIIRRGEQESASRVGR